MFNFKKLIYHAISLLIIAGLCTALFFIKRENGLLGQNNAFLTSQNESLTQSLQAALKIKNYSISLAPTINNKVTSAFGSTKNVTLQYYFKMDGNTLEVKPDSVLYIQKIE